MGVSLTRFKDWASDNVALMNRIRVVLMSNVYVKKWLRFWGGNVRQISFFISRPSKLFEPKGTKPHLRGPKPKEKKVAELRPVKKKMNSVPISKLVQQIEGERVLAQQAAVQVKVKAKVKKPPPEFKGKVKRGRPRSRHRKPVVVKKPNVDLVPDEVEEGREVETATDEAVPNPETAEVPKAKVSAPKSGRRKDGRHPAPPPKLPFRLVFMYADIPKKVRLVG
jgi:hypothetical protein